MKRIRQMILCIFFIILGSLWSIIFTIMGALQYYKDSIDIPAINWRDMVNSSFAAVPYGIIVVIVSSVFFVMNYIAASKEDNHR